MKSLTRGNARAAMKALRANKWRSFLTMLGIIIGVSSVITVVSIGQGVQRQVAQQINHVGKDLITIRPGLVSAGGLSSLGLSTNRPAGQAFTNRDLEAVQKTKGVGQAVPLGIVSGMVRGDLGAYNDGPVVATSTNFPAIVNQSVAYGVFLTEDDNDQNVAVLGSHAATKLFNAGVPLGETFSFRGQDFTVRGILNDFISAPLSSDVDFNDAIFIPYGTALAITHGNAGLYEVLAKPATGQPASTVVNTLQASLQKQHGDSHDFSVLRQSQAAAETSRVLSLLTELITGVAAISLFVGGIGIMNIMLVSVTERMHEIGIRKAVGATNKQILSEFVTEAATLSVVGSLVGIAIAAVINVVLRILTSLTPVFNWEIMLASAGVSIIVGILFGSAPALKAARKDPISALRGE